MRLAICGEGRSGKDTTAAWLQKYTTLRYRGSTSEAATAIVFSKLREKYGYKCGVRCFEDRHNHREEWAEIIWKFNEPDGLTLYRQMLHNSDILNGIRRKHELEAVSSQLIDLTIYIERDVPNDPSNEIFPADCDIIIPNHGTVDELHTRLERLTRALDVYCGAGERKPSCRCVAAK